MLPECSGSRGGFWCRWTTAAYRSGMMPMRGTRRHPRYFRPAEVELLLGDPSKARRELGWEPKVKFKELVEMMVDADTSCVPQRHGADARNATTVADQMREKYLQDGGYEVKNYFE